MLKCQHLIYMPATSLYLNRLQYKNEQGNVNILSGQLAATSFSHPLCSGHIIWMHKGGQRLMFTSKL